jgi:hypothetical protein
MQRCERNVVKRVVDPSPSPRASDQPGLAQHPKVMRQQRCGHLGQLRQNTRTPRSTLELAHDRPPHRIAQHPQLFNDY